MTLFSPSHSGTSLSKELSLFSALQRPNKRLLVRDLNLLRRRDVPPWKERRRLFDHGRLDDDDGRNGLLGLECGLGRRQEGFFLRGAKKPGGSAHRRSGWWGAEDGVHSGVDFTAEALEGEFFDETIALEREYIGKGKMGNVGGRLRNVWLMRRDGRMRGKSLTCATYSSSMSKSSQVSRFMCSIMAWANSSSLGASI